MLVEVDGLRVEWSRTLWNGGCTLELRPSRTAQQEQGQATENRDSRNGEADRYLLREKDHASQGSQHLDGQLYRRCSGYGQPCFVSW